MTRTKRKRLFAESGAPLPGDLVKLKPGHAYRTRPQARGHILRYSRHDEVALVLGFDEWLEDALLMSLGNNTIGWYDVKEYEPCP